MDDERLKNPPGKGHKDYFDELLERIRDIRSSERRFYQKVLDIYATSVDYAPDADFPAVLCRGAEQNALGHARQEFAAYRKFMDAQPRLVDADFEKAVKDLKKLPAPSRKKQKS